MAEVPFNQEATVEEGLVYWRITGVLDARRYDELRPSLNEFLEEGFRFFLVDLQQLESLDSRGLAFLIAVQKEARSRGGRLALVHLAARFAPLFEMTRLNRIFEIFLDVRSAKLSFGNIQGESA